MKLSIGYFADGLWAHNAFNKIINDKSTKISFICARYNTRDKTLQEYANAYNIDYFEHKNVNSKEFISNINKYKCDIFASMSFNQIFKSDIINMPKYGTINCHAGKLPFFRGRNILNWALLNDEKEFGISVHFVDEGIDTGDIILQKTYAISDEDDYASLLQKAHIECANMLYEALYQIKTKSFKRIKQNLIHPLGFYCTAKTKKDDIINWNQNSRDIFNFVRACGGGGVGYLIKQQRNENKKNQILKKCPHL